MTACQIFFLSFGSIWLIAMAVYGGIIIAKCSDIQRRIDELEESIERRSRSR